MNDGHTSSRNGTDTNAADGTHNGGTRHDVENGPRVLVVDDEPNIAEVVTMALRFEGFAVHTAASGRDALSAITSFKPHIVVLDVMLPDIDGFEVARRL